DHYLGLYGAFGYDLAFQFEPLRLHQNRPTDQRDLVLYIPDELVIVDHRLERAARHRYDFEFDGSSTEGIPRGVAGNFATKDSRCRLFPPTGNEAAIISQVSMPPACVWPAKLSRGAVFSKWSRVKPFLSPVSNLRLKFFRDYVSVIRRHTGFSSI